MALHLLRPGGLALLDDYKSVTPLPPPPTHPTRPFLRTVCEKVSVLSGGLALLKEY
jgi:hypothetical protein